MDAKRRIYMYASAHQTINALDNVLSPDGCKAVIRTNAGVFWLQPWEHSPRIFLIKMIPSSYTKMSLKMSSADGGHFLSASMY